MNSVNLIGRLTKDIDLKYTTGNEPKAYCKFTLAIDKGKDRNGNDMGADFPTITVWGKTAENCDRYIGKGDMVGVVGAIRTGKYEKDGKTYYTTDVQASRVIFLQTNEKKNEEEPEQQEMTGFSQIQDCDIPF